MHWRARTTVLELEAPPGGGQTTAVRFGSATYEVPSGKMYVDPASLASWDIYPVESLT